MSEEKGLRYNEGKNRLDLLHPKAISGLAQVLTFGAQKYPPHNWEKGMSWSSVIASLKRHLEAIERGEDTDIESGLLHADHLQCNAHFLSAYYHIYPQGDDRQHKYLKLPKIGLDIDDVIADFVPAFSNKFGLGQPTCWKWSYSKDKYFKELTKDEKKLEKFYLSIKPKINPSDIPFEPHCYITSRPVSIEITEQWIEKNGFPCSKVYSIDMTQSKLEIAKQSGIEIFVDDRFETFAELNNNGICCFLFSTSWNQRYSVGHKRINSIKELVERLS